MEPTSISVVIVDDHDLVRETWKMLLSTCRSITVTYDFSSAEEAIAKLPEINPQVILMDVNMHRLNGFEATQKILQTAPHIKIIGVSINDQPSYAKSMLQCGAKGYVTKNSTRDEMILAIKEVMKGNSYICKEVLDKINKTEN